MIDGGLRSPVAITNFGVYFEAIGAPDKVIDGALRVSFSRYTTAEECASFCEALAAARKELYPSL